MFKNGQVVGLKNSTLDGVVAGKRFEADQETLSYRIQFADHEGIEQERWLTEAEFTASVGLRRAFRTDRGDKVLPDGEVEKAAPKPKKVTGKARKSK